MKTINEKLNYILKKIFILLRKSLKKEEYDLKTYVYILDKITSITNKHHFEEQDNITEFDEAIIKDYLERYSNNKK